MFLDHFKRAMITIAIVFLISAAIVPNAQGLPAPSYPKPTLRVSVGLPDTLDPQLSSFLNEVGHEKLIYEGLTRLDSNLAVAPGAAESWVFDDEGRQITFILRENLVYSDGSILNAERFEYAILRTLDPRLSADYAAILDMITGAYEYRSADTSLLNDTQLNSLRDAVEVEALDMSGNPCTGYAQAGCRKLRIGMTGPNVAFLSIVSLWVTYPVKEELIQAGGESWWADPSYHVGNGPFKLSVFNNSGLSRFEANSRYWRGEPGYIMEIRYLDDSAAALEQYKTGWIDIMPVTADVAEEITSTPDLAADMRVYPGSCTYAVFFNNKKAPFEDQKVRAAFSYAFDREAWVNEVLAGGGLPTLTWIPQGMPGYDAGEDHWAYNPAAALQELSESTYWDGLPPITLTYSNTPRNQTRNEWIASRWEAIFGIDILLEPLDPTEYTARVNSQDQKPQTFIMGWCGDYPDPQNYLSLYWQSTSFYAQRIGYQNDEVDETLRLADESQDPATRISLYQQAQAKIIEDAPAIMAWNNINNYLVKSRVTGGVNTPMDGAWAGEVDPLLVNVFETFTALPYVNRR